MAEENALAEAYLDEVRRNFRGYKRLAEAAVVQLQEEEFFYAPDQESNSVAVIVKHISGNLRSRWTDFMTTDGEKPDRNRDQEFELDPGATREHLMRYWEDGWARLFEALAGLQAADLTRTVYIRGEPHSTVQAINRSLAHYAYHVGQIVYLGKQMRKNEWKSLSIPRGKTAEYNALKPEDRKFKPPSKG
ncbi:MAG TPA: DUF1572 family protein [Candidatus Angelobacter sp.]